jgi:hypothetical protein
MATILHEPVLRAETVELLDPAGRGLVVDCTVGTGGHAAALLEAGAERVVGLDRDAEVLPLARRRLAAWKDRVDLVHADRIGDDGSIDPHGCASLCVVRLYCPQGEPAWSPSSRTACATSG